MLPVTIIFTPFGNLGRRTVFVVNAVVISFWLEFPKLVITVLTIIDTYFPVILTPLCQTIFLAKSVLDIIISRILGRFVKTPKLIGVNVLLIGANIVFFSTPLGKLGLFLYLAVNEKGIPIQFLYISRQG